MPDPNFAIVVGIARYRDPEAYADLNGPLNDVDRMLDWLTDENGGNVDAQTGLKVLRTPEQLLNPDAAPAGASRNGAWTPDRAEFASAFSAIVLDRQGQYIRRDSRLYLYFSGHGFSEYQENVPRASLFTADAWGAATPNLPGSIYAEAVKRTALFKEVVLIMDCCRDELNNSRYGAYELDSTPGGGEQNVKLNALYAVPKRGKAQEREVPGEDGKIYGLLTHALVKSLDEGPTDVLGRISMSQLVNYMAAHWQEWYPEQPPPPPRTNRYDSPDVIFNSRKPLIAQRFSVPSALPADLSISLSSASLWAQGIVTKDKVLWRDPNNVWMLEVPFDDPPPDPDRRSFTLKLSPEKHLVRILNSDAQEQVFLPEANHVIHL